MDAYEKARLADDLGVAAYNDWIKWYNEREGTEHEEARDMDEVATGTESMGKVRAMEAWTAPLGLEVGEFNLSGSSAYITIRLPESASPDPYVTYGAVVRMSDHRSGAGPASRRALYADESISPGTWGFEYTMALILREIWERIWS